MNRKILTALMLDVKDAFKFENSRSALASLGLQAVKLPSGSKVLNESRASQAHRNPDDTGAQVS